LPESHGAAQLHREKPPFNHTVKNG
jgi:hypothetical protein